MIPACLPSNTMVGAFRWWPGGYAPQRGRSVCPRGAYQALGGHSTSPVGVFGVPPVLWHLVAAAWASQRHSQRKNDSIRKRPDRTTP